MGFMVTRILNRDSLLETVERAQEALFSGENMEGEAEAVVAWMGSRVGAPGAYAGSFGLTESDWERPCRLFTGEPLTTRAGRSHVLAEEATTLLRRIERMLGLKSEATDRAESSLGRVIFGGNAELVEKWGMFCCATCSVAVWRALAAGAYPGHTEMLGRGLETLAEHRRPEGGWTRFPYYYTLLCLSELEPGLAGPTLAAERDGLERRYRLLEGKPDPLARRRREIVRRVLEVG